jgi:hypothetical protein
MNLAGGVGAALVVLAALENRQHVAPAPAGRSRSPVVVVARVAAHVHHGIDRARAAQRLAARLVSAPPAEPGLGLGLIGPVVDRARHRHGEQDRRIDEHRAPAAASMRNGCMDFPSLI